MTLRYRDEWLSSHFFYNPTMYTSGGFLSCKHKIHLVHCHNIYTAVQYNSFNLNLLLKLNKPPCTVLFSDSSDNTWLTLHREGATFQFYSQLVNINSFVFTNLFSHSYI